LGSALLVVVRQLAPEGAEEQGMPAPGLLIVEKYPSWHSSVSK
jgi:hypothetical protein